MANNFIALETVVQCASQQEQAYHNLMQRQKVDESSVSNKRTILGQGVQDEIKLSDFLKTKDFKVAELIESSARAQQSLTQTSEKTNELRRIIEERLALQQSDITNYESQATEKAEIFRQGPLLFSRRNVSLQMADMRIDREFVENQINEDTKVLEEVFVHMYESLHITSDGSAEEISLESVRKYISILLDIKEKDEDEKKQLESEEQQAEAAIKRKKRQLCQ